MSCLLFQSAILRDVSILSTIFANDVSSFLDLAKTLEILPRHDGGYGYTLVVVDKWVGREPQWFCISAFSRERIRDKGNAGDDEDAFGF